MKANRRFLLLLCACAAFQVPVQEGEAALSSLGTETKLNAEPMVVFEALCKALQENYPMLEYAGWRDDKWPVEFRRRIATAASRQEAYELMDELVCRLNDYHTRFAWPGKPRLVSPPFQAEPVAATGSVPADHSIWGRLRPPIDLPTLEGIAIVVVSASTNCEARNGDEILGVNDLPVHEALAQAWRHAVGCSIAGKLRSAAGRMLRGETGSELRLKVRRLDSAVAEQVREIAVSRSTALEEQVISSQEVGGVPVIHIARFENPREEDLVARFDELLSRYRTRPGLIIDVRQNGGGKDELASKIVGRFIDAPVISSISFRRQVPDLTFERTIYWTEPRPWRYEGRVAVLTDEGCMSATEHFISGMAEGGALLCGTPSSGACGLIRRVELPGGATLNVSRTFPLHTAGIPSPLLGIAPHRWASRTLTDVRGGRDTALRAAIAWVNGREPLPVRFQPMVTFSGKP